MAATNPLQKLGEHGQSVWLDYISRELVTSGELERLVADSNVTGLTSNPTIFEKAIAHGTDYDAQIRELLSAGVTDPNDIFFALAISDIQRACDILRPVWERTSGADGFASLEVAPSLAHDTAGTNAMVDDLWKRVDRPNLMVKIPATPEGVPAIETALANGRNINVTLIFALAAHADVINAYLTALETRHGRGEKLDVHSVASFFVSRVDTAVDKLLDAKLAVTPGDAKLEALLGTAAIANARLAYELFEQQFHPGPRFAALQKDGAAVQRPLWASTSAKNPNYRDVVYAEALIGRDTVDTMPPATIDAFRDHGVVETDTVTHDYDGQRKVLQQLSEVGIGIDDITSGLLRDGVESFAKSYDDLISVIAKKVDEFEGGFSSRRSYQMGDSTTAIDDIAAGAETTDVGARIWRRDADLWKPGDAAAAAVIHNRLGWLDVVLEMRTHIPRLLALGDAVRDEGIDNVVLLGMGGSSLCPEVLRTSLGSAAGFPTLHVLDTTDPVAITQLTSAIDPHRALFVVASKSGGTLETLSHFAHFWSVVTAAGISSPGGHFVAITDPGSHLADVAREHGFRDTFENPADIGGRYSAMSFFGLVPAALSGIDITKLIDRAASMRTVCSTGMPGDLNAGLWLGVAIGHAYHGKRDKVTILAPDDIAAFSLWAEQLIAESTGKEGKGIIPIGAEPIGDPSVYGDDRIFVALRLANRSNDSFDAAVASLRSAGHPVVTLDLADVYDLAAEFFRWEFATAAVGHVLEVDVFDEPNVQESKDNTKKVLAQVEGSGKLPAEPAADEAELMPFLAAARDGDYIATMAYVTPTDANEQALQEFRTAIRDTHRKATTLGFGPRFLHSTGQLHKGGPNTGVFVQITTNDTVDVPIPGQPFSFSILKQAQAIGDLQSLRDHGRRVIHLHLGDDLIGGLARLTEALITASKGVATS